MRRRATPMLTQNTFPDKSILFCAALLLSCISAGRGSIPPRKYTESKG